MEITTMKQTLLGFFSLYVILLVFLSLIGNISISSNHRELPSVEEVQLPREPYKFINPQLAFEVLDQLEVFDETTPNSGFKAGVSPYLDLKSEDIYCDKRRAYFALYPEVVFEDMPWMSDLGTQAMARSKMLMQLGTDIQPYIGSHMSKTGEARYEIDPSITNFYFRMTVTSSKRLGKHFACSSQIYSQLAGKIVIDNKSTLSEAVFEYGKRYQDRPQCFNPNKYLPQTYMLYQKQSCENFFEVFNSPEYKDMKREQKIVYLKKAGKDVHMGEGVEFVTEKEEQNLKTVYANGANCGKINDLFLIQKYIPNPLLIHGRKFDFRSYMLIASANPLIAYYHDPTLRVSLMQYDVASNDKKTLLTNIALNKVIYSDAKDGLLYNGMGELELKLEQQWTFQRFQDYLIETGVVKDRAWFDENLRPQFKKAMIHLIRLGFISVYKSSSLYAIFGLDFMLDENLHLWFIEANSAPGMGGFSEPVEEFVLKMLRDKIEIVMGLLRSRMKRVIGFVNGLIEDGSVREGVNGEVTVRNLATNRMIFAGITENYFEDEFMPSVSNGFSKIIDENYKGSDKYLGFISSECL